MYIYDHANSFGFNSIYLYFFLSLYIIILFPLSWKLNIISCFIRIVFCNNSRFFGPKMSRSGEVKETWSFIGRPPLCKKNNKFRIKKRILDWCNSRKGIYCRQGMYRSQGMYINRKVDCLITTINKQTSLAVNLTSEMDKSIQYPPHTSITTWICNIK